MNERVTVAPKHEIDYLVLLVIVVLIALVTCLAS